MEYSAVIPCGGIGSRLNLGYNKILYKYNDKILVEKTIENFINDDECKEIVIVCNETDFKTLKDVIKHPKVKFTLGGNTREESVKNGLEVASYEYVLIHDGARCNVTKELIDRVKNKLQEVDYVIPVVKSKDASLINNEYHQKEVLLIQTPQATKRTLLLNAMNNVDITTFKDDISIICHYYKVNPYTVEGDYNNIKITTKEDLKYIKEN